jgi:hypothetical protein
VRMRWLRSTSSAVVKGDGPPHSAGPGPRPAAHRRGRPPGGLQAWPVRPVLRGSGRFLHRSSRRRPVSLLKTVLHDWDDDRATAILRICRPAARDGGRAGRGDHHRRDRQARLRRPVGYGHALRDERHRTRPGRVRRPFTAHSG